jgi:predicted phage terminase large subunit-like protein
MAQRSNASQTTFEELLNESAQRLDKRASDLEGEQSPPLTFIEWVSKVKPSYQWHRHCIVLANALQRVADGELKRLMVFIPPRHGKSEEVSRLFPAYFLYRHPDKFVGLGSYSQGLANTLSRAAKNNYQLGLASCGGVPLAKDARAVKQWETDAGGGFWCTGVGGEATGKGFHVGIIDDPLKNSEQAASETIREKQKEWWNSTWYTREQPLTGSAEQDKSNFDAAFIVVQTRWHEDDLSGWLLSEEIAAAKDPEENQPERWHIVSFPAIAEESPAEFPETCTVEPDWREPGEELAPALRPLAKLLKIAKRVGEYVWGALFQQRPRAKDGSAFLRAWFEDNLEDAAPLDADYVRYWDKAASRKKGADWTAGVLMCRCRKTGIFYVVHVLRGRWATHERDQHIRSQAFEDASRYGDEVYVRLEREGGSSGMDSALAAVANLVGFLADTESPSGPKEVRFDGFAAQAKAGNVRFVRGAWNRDYVEELTALWNGAHDDQADGTSGAFNFLARLAWGNDWFVV